MNVTRKPGSEAMDKVEEILPRIASYLKDDLAKESLSSKAEKKRLYYVSRIEEALQDSAAQEIIAKYEPWAGDSGGGARRSTVLQGNVIPTPFNRMSPPAATAADTKRTEKIPTAAPNQVAVAYEVLPCDLYEEVHPKGVYEEAILHGTSDGEMLPPLHPPNPPPPPPLHLPGHPTLPAVYEEAFQSNPERIPEASSSGSDTDYEVYAEVEEREDDTTKHKESTPVRHNSSKSKNKGRPQTLTADLTGRRYSGYLHQKGTFQFQRRFCALCGTRFLCCKSERSLKVVVEVNVREYEIVHQERREGKTSSYPQELRFSCPGKETYLFYTESKQSAEEWIKELRRAATVKQDSVEASADVVDSSSLADDADRQSENGENNISGGSIDKTKSQNQNPSEDVRKKSKLQSLLGTFGKKLGNKTKTLLQAIDLSNPQAMETDQEFGHVSIRSEEFTGDRWFKRFCRIENGQLNCYTDQLSTDVRPEFSLDLRGAQLKPLEEKDELKIKLVKDGKEHCLKMYDFMHHGQWLMSLIHETGYANQLASKASCNKNIYEQPVLYEELRQFIVLDGVTEDDTLLDEEPPPLPTASPPASPMPASENSRGPKNLDGGLKKKSDPEGIYLQPVEWLQDLEEIKKKRKPLNIVECPVQEESAYINRDFARNALNSRERVPKKDIHKEKGSINSCSSYPNLTSVGTTPDGGAGSGTDGNDPPREAAETDRLADREAAAGSRTGKFRPASALVESLETLADMAESPRRRNGKGLGAAKGSSRSFDRSAGLLLQPPNAKKRDDHFTGAGCQKKADDNFSKANPKMMMWDESLRNNRRRTSASRSTDDLRKDADHNKNMVHSLVQLFERKA